jgi:hypothetical protein
MFLFVDSRVKSSLNVVWQQNKYHIRRAFVLSYCTPPVQIKTTSLSEVGNYLAHMLFEG